MTTEIKGTQVNGNGNGVGAETLLERPEQLSDEYRKVLIETLIIAAQQEVVVMPWQATAFETAPDLGAKISIAGSIQDELGHANQWCLALDGLGYDSREAIFGVAPEDYKTVFVEHFKIRDYVEFVMAQAFFDRGGRLWTLDFEKHSSWAPMRCVAKKVNFEQAFHVFHGAQWTRYYLDSSEDMRRHVTQLAQELFPHGQQWFGAPDSRKSRKGQLDFRIRGWSNDEMRAKWMKSIAAFARRAGFELPIKYDEGTGQYVSTIPFPLLYDNEKRAWGTEEVDWSDVIALWRRGGPDKLEIVSKIHNEEWGSDLW